MLEGSYGRAAVFGAILSVIPGCGGNKPQPNRGGEELECPDGSANPGQTIITVNCSTVVQYDGDNLEASIDVKELGGAGFKNVETALRDVDEAATSAQVQFTQTCELYNGCNLTSAEYRSRLDKAQAHFRSIREKVALLKAANGNPEVLRQTFQQLYLDAVPAEKAAESLLGMEMTVQAKKSGAAASVVHDGDTLKTGDEVVFGVRVSQAAYIYVFQKKEGGTLDVLFPNPQISNLKNPIEAGNIVRIPPKGQVFTLDDEDLGREQVFIAASPRALTDLEEALNAANSGADGAEEKVGSAMGDLFSEGAPECESGTRGLKVKSESGCGSMTRGLTATKSSNDDFFAEDGTVQARTSPGDDVILQTFSFIHE